MLACLKRYALAAAMRVGFTIPELDYLALSTDPRGDVRVTLHARIGGSVKLAVSKSAQPSAATVRAASANNLDANKNFASGVLQSVRSDEKTFLSAFAYELEGGAGAESSRLYAVESEVGGERFRTRVSHSTTQNVNNATLTVLSFNTEAYDVGTLHDTSTNNSRLTIPAGGDLGAWSFTAQINWDTDGAGQRELIILKNGSTNVAKVIGPPTGGGFETIQQITYVENAPTVGDYFEIRVRQNSGGTRTVAAIDTWFAATHLW